MFAIQTISAFCWSRSGMYLVCTSLVKDSYRNNLSYRPDSHTFALSTLIMSIFLQDVGIYPRSPSCRELFILIKSRPLYFYHFSPIKRTGYEIPRSLPKKHCNEECIVYPSVFQLLIIFMKLFICDYFLQTFWIGIHLAYLTLLYLKRMNARSYSF